MKKEYLYKYLDSSKDNPNNEQIKIDRINGFKKCLVCQETKDLSKFVYRRGKFDLNCLKCKNEKHGVGKRFTRLIFEYNGVQSKKCTNCKQIKSLDFFHKTTHRNKTGYWETCKECKNSDVRDSYYRNKPQRSLKNKKWQKNNPDKVSQGKKRQREKNKNNPFFKINKLISNGIRSTLQRNNLSKRGRPWETLVTFTAQELKLHLESLFTDGMNWQNQGKNGWHIDHILPVELFEYTNTNDLQFKYCWSLKNFRPLWAKENWEKYDFLPNGKQASKMSTEEKKQYFIEIGLGYLFD